ncbi:MAG: GlsB/YeaQ/YmgE family stress response membrane protein [Chloroflexi bacterium]|nr:MAG: GlsB/YeaQ/YmgE family stress response membrane protein [Chloroflexota bacterium]
MVVNLDFDTILIWLLVGLVAGFFASHLALGHGLGIVGDVVVGIIGAFLGGFLAGAFHWAIVIAGHPILIVRIVGMGRGARRRPYWS